MNLVERAKNIILTPKTEWAVVASETPDTSSIITGYVIPLTLLSALAGFSGALVFGLGMPIALVTAISAIIFGVVGILIEAWIIDALAPSFGSEKDFGRSLQLVAYSSTAGWVAGILNFIPFLGFVTWIGSLYGIYLIYLGLEDVKKTPEDKRVTYTIVSLVVVFVVLGVITAIVGGILLTIFLGIFGTAAVLAH